MYRSGEISINPSPERLCGLFLETFTFVCPVFLNPPIDGALWLTFLQKLSYGHSFNQPEVGIAWPASRQHVSLGLQRGVVWLASVQRLSYGDDLNRPVVGAEWPDSLQRSSLGHNFDQPIVGVDWPASLHIICHWETSTAVYCLGEVADLSTSALGWSQIQSANLGSHANGLPPTASIRSDMCGPSSPSSQDSNLTVISLSSGLWGRPPLSRHRSVRFYQGD